MTRNILNDTQKYQLSKRNFHMSISIIVHKLLLISIKHYYIIHSHIYSINDKFYI